MKKFSILAAATSATVTMALSLSLLACGDNSSTGPETPIADNESSSSEGAAGLSSSSDVESSSAIAPESSGATEPSSSETVPESSSGIEPESSATVESSSSVWVPHQAAKDIASECLNGSDRGVTMDTESATRGASDLVVDVNEIVDGPGGTPPVAYKFDNDDGYVTYVIESVMLNCGANILGIDVSAEDDTLFAQLELDPNSELLRCICDTRVSFKIEKDSHFTNTTRLVIDGDMGNVYRIISGTYNDISLDKGF